MVVRGQGSVGKSTLIEAVMQTFEDMGSLPMLSKTLTSGMTASLIRGMTVHLWVSIPVASPSSEDWTSWPSRNAEKACNKNIKRMMYLLLDEYSMLTKELLTLLSQVSLRTMW
jgi:MoxR-like ATPase